MTDIEHPIIAALHGIANVTAEYPCDLLEATRARFVAQINQHNVNARLDAIAAAFVWATAEEREGLIEEAAELLTLDPDECNVLTPPVSDEQDERNSRPLPY
jgi:antibiotic biosynthesis monooxygenase (ABM) superfamily enzyme